jgi:excisionase family DNA binding protein
MSGANLPKSWLVQDGEDFVQSAAQANAPIAYTIRAAVWASGLSRSRIYELIAAGRIEARKEGRRTLIMAASLQRYLETLPTVQPRKVENAGGNHS